MQGGRQILDVVTQPIGTVKVNNSVREAESVSIDRELPTDLPEAVVGTGGFLAATGSVTWAPRTRVSSSADNPWTRAAMLPPMPGDDIFIDVGLDDQEWRQLTGKVDASSGAIAAGTVETTVVDHTDQLRSHRVQQPALLATMPTTSRFRPPRTWSAGLTAISMVDRFVRRCGFSSTPRPSADALFAVSLLGDLHPDLGGELAYAPTTVRPGWVTTPWGPAVARPSTVVWTLTDPRIGPRMDGFEFSVQTSPSGDTREGVFWVGYDTSAAVAPTSARRLVQVSVRGSSVTVSTLTQTFSATTRTYSGRTSSRVSGRVTFKNDGAVAVLSMWDGDRLLGAPLEWTVPALPDNSSHPWVLGMSGTLPLGGFVLDRLWPTARPPLIDQQPNMVWDVDTLHDLEAFPAIMGREVLDLVREASTALCASVWLDEYGTLHWLSRGRLATRTPATELTSADSLIDLAWSASSAGVRSRIRISWDQPAITVSQTYGVPLWQAPEIVSEETMMSTFIHPGGDEDWIGVDTELKYPSGTPPISDADILNAVGTWAFVHTVAGGYGPVDATLDQLDPQTLLFTAKNRVADSRASWSTPDDFPLGELQNVTTPFVRGRARVQWTATSTTSTTRGPELAPEYDHAAGPWIQREAEALELAQWLAGFTSVAVPRVESLSIVPDPRIQLGDVVSVRDSHVTNVALRGVVVAIHVELADANLTQTLSLRVITAEVKAALLGDHDAAWRGGELGEQDEFWTLATLGDLDTNPTRST